MATQWPRLDTVALRPQRGLTDLIEEQLSPSKAPAIQWMSYVTE